MTWPGLQGVSPPTVSRALLDDPRVSLATPQGDEASLHTQGLTPFACDQKAATREYSDPTSSDDAKHINQDSLI